MSQKAAPTSMLRLWLVTREENIKPLLQSRQRRKEKEFKASNIICFGSQLQRTSYATGGKQPATTIKFPITSQSIKEKQLKLSPPMGFLFVPLKSSALQRWLLNPKLTASNVRAWTIKAYQGKMIETKQTFAGKMVSVIVDLCKQKNVIFWNKFESSVGR